ncbi:MAG: hypothetical protein ABI670_18975 [Chloroflexota bacterium]
MKRRSVILLISVAVVIVAGYFIQMSLAASRTSSAVSVSYVGIVTELSKVPLYSGALLIEKDDSYPRAEGSILYYVDASVKDVEAFYTDQLTSLHWQSDWVEHRRADSDSVNLNWQTPKLDDTASLHFSRLNDEGDEPYDLSLLIDAEDTGNVKGTPGSTSVIIYLARVPNLSRVPLLPDASEIKKAERGQTRTLEYITATTANGVLDYYTDVMPKYGWRHDGPALDLATGQTLPGSLLFSWGYGGVDTESWEANVQVTTEPVSIGLVKVNLRVTGKTNLR